MANAKRLTLHCSGWSIIPVGAGAFLLLLLLGTPGLAIAGFLALPWLAWRYDNETGTFLPLAVLVLFLFGVLALLLFLMALVLK